MKERHSPRWLVVILLLLWSGFLLAEDQLPHAPLQTLPKNPDRPAPTSMTDIHDIKPPVVWGVDPLLLKTGILLVLALLACSGGLWLFFRWRRSIKKDSIQTLVPELSPEDCAYKALDEIKGRMQSDPRDYYFKLSEIIRGYIKRRFDIEALEMTTEELLPRISGLDLDNRIKMELKDFIRETDPVKFGGARAYVSTMECHHDLVKRFVAATTPEYPVFAERGNEAVPDSDIEIQKENSRAG